MSPRPALPDASDRTRATTLLDRNVVVIAGAGTGKTALLVERILNLIGARGDPIESIAAITFTEKAAADLRRRLAIGLDELRRLAAAGTDAGGLDPATEACRSYAWLRAEGRQAPETIAARALEALTRLDAASVSTIHSFCAEILRRHPREAGVDPDFAVDEGPGADLLFEEEWARFLEAELGRGATRPEAWRRALGLPGALEAIGEIGRALASFAYPAEALVAGGGEAGPPPSSLLAETIEALRSAALRLAGGATGINPNMRVYLEASAVLLEACRAGGPETMAAASVTLPIEEYLRKSLPSPGRGLTGAIRAEVEEVAKRARELIRQLARVDDNAIVALVEVARPLAAQCRERLLRRGLVTFDALLRLTRDLLRRDPDVRRSLARRFRRILVDEFQDTDPLQYEILFFIAESGEDAAADPYAARLEPGRLFIVGDPKQSIYRFRGADIEAYRRAVERVRSCDGETCTLTASFRSPAEIVAPINRLFSEWIGRAPAADAIYEPPYDPIVSARGPAGEDPGRVEIWSVPAAGPVPGRRRAEAEAIAAWIAGHVSPDATVAGSLAYGQIAILLRALTNAGLYARALQRAGVPFIVDGGKDFYERPEVGDLIAFLRAACTPNDGASVLAVLRSPLGATEDAELARFALAGGRLDRPVGGLADLSSFPGIRRTFALLESFRSRLIGRAPDDVIREALTAAPLALLHASSFEGAQRVANLRKLVARASDHARGGLSLEEILRVLEEEYQGERTEGESPLADETVNAVRLLSVHKAKGLEYPVVFVPDLGREPNRAAVEGVRTAWVRRDGGCLAVRLADGTCNLAWVFHRESTRRHEAAEEKRVFYVACTRARERLILVNSNPGRRAPWRDALAALGYGVAGGFPADGILAEGVRHRRMAPPPLERIAPARRESRIWVEATSRFEEVSAAASASAVPPLRWPAGSGDERAAIADGGAPPGTEGAARPTAYARADGPGRETARLAGTAVHGALEGWDLHDDPGRLREQAALEARRLAEERGSAGRGAAGRAGEVARAAEEIVAGFLASPLPARLASVEILGREVPILYRDEEGTTWLGACDLIYRDRDGTTVVADYKTDRVEGDPAAAAERYRAQMAVYLEALRRALPGKPVRGEILFLRTGEAVSL